MEQYKFSELQEVVESLFNIDTEKVKSKFEPPPRIRIEIKQHELDSKIKIDETGIYYTDGEKKVKGFLYIPIFDPGLWASKGWNDMPRFHSINCKIIQRQRWKSNFDGHYVFSSEPVTDLSGANGKKRDIDLCSYCRNIEEYAESMDSTTYYNEILLDPSSQGNFVDKELPKEILVGDGGYTPDWDETSRIYRIKKKFTCEDCGIRLNNLYVHGYFLETHHINGNKSDNSESNLRCLCTLCHAYSDANHLQNFSYKKIKPKLVQFVSQFEKQLKEVKNQYLSDFLHHQE
jgi:hypothetical protein